MVLPRRIVPQIAFVWFWCIQSAFVYADSYLNCRLLLVSFNQPLKEKVDNLALLHRNYINADSNQKEVMRIEYIKVLDRALDDLLIAAPDLAAKHQIGPEVFFDARLRDPRSPLNFDELVILSSDPVLRFIYKNLLKLQETNDKVQNSRVIALTAQAYTLLKTLTRKMNFMHSDDLATFKETSDLPVTAQPASILRKALSASTDTAGVIVKQVARIISPLPPNVHGKVERLFLGASLAHKQLITPELGLKQLSPEDAEFLIEHNLVDAFERRGKFLVEHPKLRLLRLSEKNLGQTAQWLSYSAALILLFSSDDEDTVTLPELGRELEQSERKIGPKPDEIQLLNTLSPLPHLAIRIGDQVYSYGIDQMKVWPVMEYLSLDPIARRAAKKNSGKSSDSGNLFDIIHPASIQATTIKLGANDVKKLQAYLEAQNNKIYLNKTGVNDCATMVIRALKQNTKLDDPFLRLIDSSPSQITMSLAALKAMGDNRITKIQTILQTQTDRTDWHKLRNAWENKIESSFFLNPAIFAANQISRYHLDQSYGIDQLQIYTQEDDRYLSKLEEANLDFMGSDVFLALVPVRLKVLSEQKNISSSELFEFKQLTISLLEEKRKELKASLKNSSIDIATKKEISGSIEGLDAFVQKTNKTLMQLESRAVK